MAPLGGMVPVSTEGYSLADGRRWFTSGVRASVRCLGDGGLGHGELASADRRGDSVLRCVTTLSEDRRDAAAGLSSVAAVRSIVAA